MTLDRNIIASSCAYIVSLLPVPDKPLTSNHAMPYKMTQADKVTGGYYGRIRILQGKHSSTGGEGKPRVQERQLMGYAMMNDWTIDRMYIERGMSGSKPLNDRPQGALLLSALQAGDVILTTEARSHVPQCAGRAGHAQGVQGEGYQVAHAGPWRRGR